MDWTTNGQKKKREGLMDVKDWLGEDNEIGIDIWHRKYQDGDETFDEWLDRVSGGYPPLKQLILEKKFLFGGRILANRGVKSDRKTSYSNCYYIPTEDSIEGIYTTAKEMARTFSYGGGVGIDISNLAPNGAKVRNAAEQSTGAVSFMDLFSLTSELIGQGARRGALMLSMSCDHPDIEEFINVKNDLNKVTGANISVKVTEAFMNAVINDEDWELHFHRKETGEDIKKTIKAKELFHELAEANWRTGEPGILFWDKICKYNLVSNIEAFEFGGVNPCFTGDMRILTEDGYKTFEELDGKTQMIYRPDEEVVPAKFWCSGEKEVVRIEFADLEGTFITCTPDHLFKLKDGTWCQAQDLIGRYVRSYEGRSHLVLDVQKLQGKRKVYDFSESTVHEGIVNGYIVHNCGELPLPAYGACLLGSINLSAYVLDPFTEMARFDYISFTEDIPYYVHALNEVLEEGLYKHPLSKQTTTAKRWKPIGLGIMGLADALIMMGKRYGSDDSLELCKQIASIMANQAMTASAIESAQPDGLPFIDPFEGYEWEKVCSSPFFLKVANAATYNIVQKAGLKNAQLLTIAPTGTIATMLGISSGIEPVYSNSYTRTTKSLGDGDVDYKIFSPIVKDFMSKYGVQDEENLPSYFVTAKEIDYHDRIAMQSTWQKYIDNSISSTVNVPHDFTVEQIEDLYIEAWKSGCKGITIFRDGCERKGILSDDSTTECKEADISDTLKRGYIKKIGNDAIGLERHLTTGCGSLHCSAFFDKETGELLEIYLSKGSKGGCLSSLTGLSRMISVAARGGVKIEDIVDQLNSSIGCSAYAVRRATKKDTSKGTGCPAAVGHALADMYEEIKEIISSGDFKTVAKNNTEQDLHSNACPQCGESLVFEGGCQVCKACGWSKCE